MSIKRKIKNISAVAVLGAMACWSSIASADPITVDFEATGFDTPGTLSGWFTGDDSIGFIDGLLADYEVTAFELIWSGNSTTAAFTHGLGDLTSLLYDIGSNTLLLLTSNSGGGFGSPSASIVTFFGYPVSASVNGTEPFGCQFVNRRLSCSDPDSQTVNHPGVVTTTKVPEPGTLTLFGIGLLAAGFASRRRNI